MMVY
jgi:hypothetical protein